MANLGEQGEIHIDFILREHSRKLAHMRKQFRDPQIVESCDVADRKILVGIRGQLQSLLVLVGDLLMVAGDRDGDEISYYEHEVEIRSSSEL